MQSAVYPSAALQKDRKLDGEEKKKRWKFIRVHLAATTTAT